MSTMGDAPGKPATEEVCVIQCHLFGIQIFQVKNFNPIYIILLPQFIIYNFAIYL